MPGFLEVKRGKPVKNGNEYGLKLTGLAFDLGVCFDRASFGVRSLTSGSEDLRVRIPNRKLGEWIGRA